jgi:TonB-dependent SusC/RagA subfamily outer membrane receptor
MKKNLKPKVFGKYQFYDAHTLKKLFRTMRITLLCFFLGLAQVMAVETYAQMTKLSMKVNNEPLELVLKFIEDESEFFFLYNRDLIDVEQKVSVNAENKTIKSILDDVLEETDISYVVYDRQIVLTNTSVINEMVAQQNAVSGKVTDVSGQPLPGVTVLVKGTTTGTVTNADGNYTISNIPENATLQFSFVGMKTQEIIVGNQTSINVSMIEDAIGLEEVVAIGYGTQKKANLTGSVATVSSKDITVAPVKNITNTLAGRLPGLFAKQESGVPGSDAAKLSIRGFGDALIIVDGVERSFNNLDPNEIETISILKDGAAAIYGSRAGNGVILVTTKKREHLQTCSYL